MCVYVYMYIFHTKPILFLRPCIQGTTCKPRPRHRLAIIQHFNTLQHMLHSPSSTAVPPPAPASLHTQPPLQPNPTTITTAAQQAGVTGPCARCSRLLAVGQGCAAILGTYADSGGVPIPANEDDDPLAHVQRLVAWCQYSNACMQRTVRLLQGVDVRGVMFHDGTEVSHDLDHGVDHDQNSMVNTARLPEVLQAAAARVAAIVHAWVHSHTQGGGGGRSWPGSSSVVGPPGILTRGAAAGMHGQQNGCTQEHVEGTQQLEDSQRVVIRALSSQLQNMRRAQRYWQREKSMWEVRVMGKCDGNEKGGVC